MIFTLIMWFLVCIMLDFRNKLDKVHIQKNLLILQVLMVKLFYKCLMFINVYKCLMKEVLYTAKIKFFGI